MFKKNKQPSIMTQINSLLMYLFVLPFGKFFVLRIFWDILREIIYAIWVLSRISRLLSFAVATSTKILWELDLAVA